MAQIQVPPGLDEFLAGPTAPMPDAVVPQAPAGLDEFIAPEMKEEKYGTTEQQLKAGAEGLAQGVAGPLAPMLEKKLGVNPEDIRARADVNPGAHFAGEVGGLLAPAIASGGASLANKAGLSGTEMALKGMAKLNQASALESAGSAVAKKLAPVTLSGKIGVGAAKAAVENMLLAGSDETSKLILNDPNASAHNAIASVALSGLLGGALGGTMSGLGGLFDSKLSGKTGQMIADFKGRIAQHIETPDPVKTMHEELSNSLSEMNKVADDTFGANGIKADAISKLVPKEVTPEISEQFMTISDKLDSSLSKLSEKSDPHTGLLENKIEKFKQAANSQDTTTMFNAIQDLKQELQAESRYTEGLSPLSERSYRGTVKNLAHDLRTSLEDSKVWGDAAHVQAEINSAASKYFPAIKDFKSLMTTKIMGEPQVDPGKINTYLNQLGKANAEVKQAKMQNFIDNSEMFKAAVNKAYDRVGIESPIKATPMAYTMSTLGEKTTGSKLADLFISKGLTDAGGKSIGAAVGGGLGHALGGHGEIGALIGAHALGPFFSSVMPAVAKSVLKLPASGAGFRAATNYGAAVAKGEGLLSQASKNIFRLGAEVLPQSYIPTEKDRSKLQKVLDKLKVDPSPLLNAKNDVGHYLPDHSSAVNATAMTAINYLNGLKPDESKKAPLDSKPVLSSTAKAKYDNALNIAEQPMIVLDKIKRGTLNQNDMQAIQTMYPDLYNRMKTKVLGEIVDSQTKGKIVPYKTRTSLSLFMGQPIDSSLTPASIQSMQPTAQGNQQQSHGGGSQLAPKRSTASLSKMGSMYKTPEQTAAGRRQRED